MRLARLLLLPFVLLAFVACETPTTPGTRTARELSFISLERTPNGAGVAVGPVYTVTLLEDGRVMFEGVASVKSKGTFTKNIPPKDALRLFRTLDGLDIWNRPRRYDVERAERRGDSVITRTASNEVPWDIIRAHDRGRTIRIDGLFFAPSDLLEFKAQIERTIGLADWIGPPEEWKR